MKTSVLFLIIAIIISGCASQGAVKAETSLSCRTKYPVLLVHGIGYRDDVTPVSYWGRVPQRLSLEGAQVYLSGQNAFSSHSSNAFILKSKIDEIIAKTGAKKVNIIAHSKGGIEARYLITALGQGGHVASLTTLACPHWGSSFADYMIETIAKTPLPAAELINIYAGIIGDAKPDSLAAGNELTRKFMSNFNMLITNDPEVYYQSYGFMMKQQSHNSLFYIPHQIILSNEGPNDGMVSTNSAAWGNFRGVFSGDTHGSGLSHIDITDIYGKDVSGVDIPGFYVNIVRDLKDRGY